MFTKKILPSMLAAAVVASMASISVFASESGAGSGVVNLTNELYLLDDDGDYLEDNSGDSYGTIADALGSGTTTITLDGIAPNQTFYIPLGTVAYDTITTLDEGGLATASSLVDDDLFKLSVDKDGSGKSLIKSITQVSEKSFSANGSRGSYLKVVLNDSTTTSELKATAELTFKAKSDMEDGDSGYELGSNEWQSGETAVLNLTMWINNSVVEGSDGAAETGESVYFSPESNEDNVIVWGDDRAALEFATDDDADDFYAKLSTKADSEIYATYGDPVNADLYFYDFVGNPAIPTTSRATLTLGIPWDDDDDYVPDPEDCYIYTIDSDGTLTDVTSLFTYSEDEQEIPGWSIKTRTLGTYVLSDTELDVTSTDYSEEEEESTEEIIEEDTDKDIPNTGSSDLVNVAVAAAVVSLSAAAVLAFRKASR